MPRLSDLRGQLDRLDSEGLLRVPETTHSLSGRSTEGVLMASSNDYLGLAAANVSRETLAIRVGSGASRLVFGSTAEHIDLESALAAWVGTRAALLFPSGFGANVGVLQSLADADSVILSDRLNHASIIDGCRLSKALVAVVEHLDLHAVETALIQAAEASARWVVTESYFSMNGTSPNLQALRDLCDRHDAYLVVDEAHALGVFGPEGAGLCREHGVQADVLIATFGKALGAQGAAVCGSPELYQWLYNRARPFVFSTAPSPLICAAVRERIDEIRGADIQRQRLLRSARCLRERLLDAGLQVPSGSYGPIVPILLGSNERVLEAHAALRKQGILVQAIRPPTVPVGTARLRVTVNAAMSEQDLDRLAEALVKLAN